MKKLNWIESAYTIYDCVWMRWRMLTFRFVELVFAEEVYFFGSVYLLLATAHFLLSNTLCSLLNVNFALVFAVVVKSSTTFVVLLLYITHDIDLFDSAHMCACFCVSVDVLLFLSVISLISIDFFHWQVFSSSVAAAWHSSLIRRLSQTLYICSLFVYFPHPFADVCFSSVNIKKMCHRHKKTLDSNLFKLLFHHTHPHSRIPANQ